jgi:tetratricopeptide (TPR) repeat protein
MLRDLSENEAPNPEHRERLAEQVLHARATHVARRSSLAQFRILGAWRRRLSVPVAAALVIAVGLALTVLDGTGPLGGARTAWALDQSIAALEGVRTVYLSGMQATGEPFECWIKPKGSGNELDSLRFESGDVIAVVRDDTVQAYFPRKKELHIIEGQFAQALRAWHLVLELRPWVGDSLLAQLESRAANWQQSRGHDEQGRDCIFVECSFPPLGISFWFAFDADTKLVVRARQWQNLTRAGKPAFDIDRIVYNRNIPDKLFELDVPDKTRVFDACETPTQRALLDDAESLYKQERYTKAIAAYLQIYERYPNWNYAAHALMMVGICYDKLDQDDPALAYLEKTVREYPDLRGWSETTYFYLGSQYRKINEPAKALWAFEKCIELCKGVRDPRGFPWKNAEEAIKKLKASNP